MNDDADTDTDTTKPGGTPKDATGGSDPSKAPARIIDEGSRQPPPVAPSTGAGKDSGTPSGKPSAPATPSPAPKPTR